MALACALDQALGGDLRVALVAPSAAASGRARDARASALSAGSRNLLAALELWGELEEEAQPVSAIEITDSSLDAGIRPVLLTYDNHLADVDGMPGPAASYILPNAAIARVLSGALAAGGVVCLDDAVAGFTQDAGAVEVDLESGRRVRAGLLVAADGARSGLRQRAGIQTVGWDYGQSGMTLRVAHEKPHGGVAVQHFLPAGPFAILPLKGPRSCITWSEEAEEAQRIRGLDREALADEVDRRFGGRLGAVTLETPVQTWPLVLRLARRFVAGRVVLIGDAAHTVHPIAGQGLNLALRDVAVLAEVVCDAMRVGLDSGDGIALQRYERWRRFDAAMSAATFDGLNRLFSRDHSVLRTAREAGLGLVDRIEPLKRLLVAEAAGLTGDVPRLLAGKSLRSGAAAVMALDGTRSG